jgi:hypothetical protein
MKNPRMAYLMANQDTPVFVSAARFEKIAEGKYTPAQNGFLIFSLDFSISCSNTSDCFIQYYIGRYDW